MCMKAHKRKKKCLESTKEQKIMLYQKLINIPKMKIAFRGEAKCLCLIRANKLQLRMR